MQSVVPFQTILLSRLVAFSCLGMAVLAQAEEAVMQPVVVTANRTPQSLTDALPHTTVLQQQDIVASQAKDLSTLLSQEAGIQISQPGGMGQVGGLFMRGAEKRQALVLIDGVRIDTQSTGGTAVSQIMLDQIDRIEVVRGNVSSIYGSSAMGGVIQIFTKQGQPGQQVNLNAELGSMHTQKLAGGVAGQKGDTRYAFNLSALNTSGISVSNPDIIKNDNPDRDGFHNRSFQGMLSQQWAHGQELGLRLFRTEGRTGYDNGFTAFVPNTVSQIAYSVLQQISLFSKNQITQDWSSLLTVSQSSDDYLSERDRAFDSRYKTRHQAVQWNNTLNFGQDAKLTMGAELDRQTIHTETLQDPNIDRSRNLSSLYAGYAQTLGQHQVQLNGRIDHTKDFGTAATYLLGYGYHFNSNIKFIANVSSAFTAPLLGQLYAPNYGNRDLRAEKGKTVELGFQYDQAGQILRATIFKTRVHDQIDYDVSLGAIGPYGYPYGLYVNTAKASNQGLELSYSAMVAATRIRASLTIQDPKDDIKRITLQRRARTFGSFSALHQTGPWSFGGTLQYTGDKPDLNYDAFPIENVTLKSYVLATLTTSYALSKDWSVYGRIENALQEHYEMAYGYNQPSRGVFVGVRWQMTDK